MTWLDAPAEVLAFARPGGLTCVVNLSEAPVDLPAHDEVVLRSGDLVGGRLAPDTAVWLRTLNSSS
jgi:alpha-glucosidase